MKIVLQGMQAVTVEFLGVVLAVWLLFGCASWGLGRSGSSATEDLLSIRPVAHKADFNRTVEKIPYIASR